MMLRALTLALVALAAPASAAAPTLDQILAGPQRSDANKARDTYRHPKQTLAFFGIKPTMTVVEVWPFGGWYAEVLAPYLRDKGRYIAAAGYPSTEERTLKSIATLTAKFAAGPATYDQAKIVRFDKGNLDVVPAGSVDAVVSFRNVHNWYAGGYAPSVFQAFHKMLKPGGTLGIEDHRLPESRADADQMSSGYLKTSTIVKLAQDAGFRLAAKSEINANPKDKADYPNGVWTLPPSYQLKDVDRAKYAAIGESDRMTLKFVKTGK